MTKKARYLKAWRKAHPGYHTEWTRRYRLMQRRKTVRILGVKVYLQTRGGVEFDGYRNRTL